MLLQFSKVLAFFLLFCAISIRADEFLTYFPVPPQAQIEALRNFAKAEFNTDHDFFSERSKGAARALYMKIRTDLLARFPTAIADSIVKTDDQSRYGEGWLPSGFHPQKGIEINVNPLFRGTAVEYQIRLHELIRALQLPLGVIVNWDLASIHHNPELRRAFLTEKTAMDWEWLYLHVLPDYIHGQMLESIKKQKNIAQTDLAAKNEMARQVISDKYHNKSTLTDTEMDASFERAKGARIAHEMLKVY